MGKKYKILDEETIDNLVSFLDEIQFGAAKENDKDSMHIVNFCSWVIDELINSPRAVVKPKKKSRDDYVDETFIDWNLPEMSDEEYESLVDQFDSFLKGWEEEYNKKNPKKKPINRKHTEFKPDIRPDLEDIAGYMSLDEIQQYLLDDPDLTTEEAFELYYDEHKRIRKQKERKSAKSLNQILKDLGIDPTEKN